MRQRFDIVEIPRNITINDFCLAAVINLVIPQIVNLPIFDEWTFPSLFWVSPHSFLGAFGVILNFCLIFR